MAAPSIIDISSIDSLHLTTLDNHLSRWSSSSSLPTESSDSRSTSSTGYTDCPTMSKSLTDSMSSDTQTENETPPESPGEEGTPVPTTPVIRDAVHRPSIGYPCRPSLPNHVSIYSEPAEGSDETDAGYETESEDKPAKGPLGKRPASRRITLDRTSFRRRGEPLSRRPASGLPNRFLSLTHIPTASHLATSTGPPSPATNTSPSPHRGSLSRPGGPTKIALPQPTPPTFPKSATKAPIGLGLGLGLPSTLSAVRRAPNCAYRSNLDPPVSSSRSFVPIARADVISTDIDPFPPIPMKPRLNPVSSPTLSEPMSPLDLSSPLFLDEATSPPGAPIQPRHAAFCFSHGSGKHADLETTVGRAAAAAFLAMAEYAQLPMQRPYPSSRSRRTENRGPPTRGSQLQSTPEEACHGDEARGIRRFEAENAYFPAMGDCVSSGHT